MVLIFHRAPDSRVKSGHATQKIPLLVHLNGIRPPLLHPNHLLVCFLRRPHGGGPGGAGTARGEEGGGADALQTTLAGGPDLHGCIHASR